MAEDNNNQGAATNEGAGTDPDYKELWEQAKADADKWKAQARKNESRAKSNAGAAKSLEGAEQQLADLSQRLAAIEGENATLKANAARSALVSEVAQETGVTETIVSTLAANDKEALTAAATAIAEAYKQPGGAPAASEAGRHVQTGGSAKTTAQKFSDVMDEILGN